MYTHIESSSKIHTHFELYFLIHFILLRPKRDPYPSLFNTHIRARLIPSCPPGTQMQALKRVMRVGPDTIVDPDPSVFPSRLVLHLSDLLSSKPS